MIRIIYVASLSGSLEISRLVIRQWTSFVMANPEVPRDHYVAWAQENGPFCHQEASLNFRKTYFSYEIIK